ncbi:hypothetical protein [Pantoea cypripedii]|uniref:Uncharacterized protein n=1 Tax=Pantoea cypripedii TaxID=55209 RepID=A0A6B9G2V2_PANCY|nr:hypothetical protein [Pantoea cypripedii]QGY31891.1 hypothetical protein CUN67_23205 [Pantoea cypripedii]
MKPVIQSVDISCNHSLFMRTLSTCNRVLENVKKITNVPCLPFSQAIYCRLHPLITGVSPTVERKTEYFLNSDYPYQHHIYLSLAINIMKKPENKKLLAKLYEQEAHPVTRFLELTGVAWAIPREVNQDIFVQLVAILEKGGALGKAGPPTDSPFASIPRNMVLLNFFSAFISAKIITVAEINEGVKSLLISAITRLSPGIGGVINMIDNFNPLLSLFPQRTLDVNQLLREETSQYHVKHVQFREGMAYLKRLFSTAAPNILKKNIAKPPVSASSTTVTTPLLGIMSAGAGILVQRPQRTPAIITGITAVTLGGAYATYRYYSSSTIAENVVDNNAEIEHHVWQGEQPSSFNLLDPVRFNSSCYNITNKVRTLLHSDQSGVRLVEEFSDFIFDGHNDIIINNAETLLKNWNVTEFTHQDRDEMNMFLTYIFSVLITPTVKIKSIDLNKIITISRIKFNIIWHKNADKIQHNTITDALNIIRLVISRTLVKSLGIVDLGKLKKLQNFILMQSTPDFMQLQNQGLGDEKVASKKIYYYWIYMGLNYFKNRYLRNEDTKNALIEGEITSYYQARIRFYVKNLSLPSEFSRFENFTRDINNEFFAYHEKDVELERLPIVTFDDVLEDDFRPYGIDIFKPLKFDRASLQIHLPPFKGLAFDYLYKCKNLRDVLRSFDDGIKELHNLMPNMVPMTFRSYLATGTSAFTLRPHPTRNDSKAKYDIISQERNDEHLMLYEAIIDLALKMITSSEDEFINNEEVKLFLIKTENRRFKLIRSIFMPKPLRLAPNVAKRLRYNTRPHCEKGLLFSAVHTRTKEKRIYSLNIEASRVHRQLPVVRLPINKTEEIAGLGDKFLDEHYVFLDKKSFWDPCDKIKEYETSISSPPEKAWEFISERYQRLTTNWCQLTRPSDYIVVFFTEKELGFATSALPLIKKEAMENRKAFLAEQKEKIETAEETESEKDKRKGTWGIIKENIPGISCIDLMNDLIINHEDNVYTSRTENFLQAMICASDSFMPSGLIRSTKTLSKAVHGIFMLKWKKRHQLKLLKEKIKSSYNLPQTSQQRYPSEVEQSISSYEAELVRLDTVIKETQNKLSTALISLAGVPSTIIFPIFNIRSAETAASTISMSLLGLAKKKLKQVNSDLKSLPFQRWEAPRAEDVLEGENYSPPMPPTTNLTCYTDIKHNQNSTTNIFDIHLKDPALYKEIFFSSLHSVDTDEIITTAKQGGWDIQYDYDKMAMFCFRSFAIPVWSYVGRILELENHYQLNANRTELNANFFYQHFKNNLHKKGPVPNLTLTNEQNLLINQAIETINQTLKSNIQAFEFNYLYMLRYLLLEGDTNLLLRITGNDDHDKEAAKREIQQNINYNLQRITLYATRSSIQERFHISVIEYLSSYIEQSIADKPSAITLFCPNLKTFRQRCIQYQRLHPDESMTTPAEYIRTEFYLGEKIKYIYQQYARIEYSIKVLADYNIDEWSGTAAQNSWMEALMEYLSPEMHLQDLKPFLADVTKRLIDAWQKEQHNTLNSAGADIIVGDVVKSEFISLTSIAFRECCNIHKSLLFCQFYLSDEGSWFTFLTNDFISETHRRSRRQIFREHPFYPLPDVKQRSLIESIIEPVKLLKPQLHQNDTHLYHSSLSNLVQNLINFSSRPYHEQLYGHVFTLLTPETISSTDAATFINNVIDDNGMLNPATLKIILRYLPMEKIATADRVLQLLSDIFKIAHPTAPELYQFVFYELQSVMNANWVTLKHLSDEAFITEQSLDFSRRYQQLIEKDVDILTQAIRRYIKAEVRDLLAFSSSFSEMSTVISSDILSELSIQQLCLGGIVAYHLQVRITQLDDLLELFSIAIRDAGIIPYTESALRQLALLSMSGSHYGEDTLTTLASCMQYAGNIQTLLINCIVETQNLTNFLSELNFHNRTTEPHLKLLNQAMTAIQSIQQLFTLVIPERMDRKLRQAHSRGDLTFTWYVTHVPHKTQDVTVAGIGFDIVSQNEGLVFPFTLPLPLCGSFHPVPQKLTNETLTRLCFGKDAKRAIPFNSFSQTPPAHHYQYNESFISEWASHVESEIRVHLHQLATVASEEDFNATKEQTQTWLKRHLPFNKVDVPFIDKINSERIISLAKHPDIQQWKTRQRPNPTNRSSVTWVEEAIAAVMGRFTDWPDDASYLRNPPEIRNPLKPDALPMTGFRGIWWDPMSLACYLGFINENERILYVSLAEDREVLFVLTNHAAHARIWAALSLQETLGEDIAALRRGEISAVLFFENTVPAACLKHSGNPMSDWQLMETQVARNMIGRGVLSPASYLIQQRSNTPSVKLTPYILQYHNGEFVFIFNENSYQKVNYGILNPEGIVQPFPTALIDWPQDMKPSGMTSSKKLFSAGMEFFLAQEKNKPLPEFFPLLNATEQQDIISSWLSEQKSHLAYIHTLSNYTAGIPFKLGFSTTLLTDLNHFMRAAGTSLNTELQKRSGENNPLNDETWDIFSWRDADLHNEMICNATLNNLRKKRKIFYALDFYLKKNILVQKFPHVNSFGWVKKGADILSKVITAIEWFKSPANKFSSSPEQVTRLYQNRLALNQFFAHYNEHPFITPNVFLQTWQHQVDQNWVSYDYQQWQQAFDQLLLITTVFTNDNRAIDRFLNLSEQSWKKAKIAKYAQLFQHNINGTLRYWRTAHQADQLMLIRPAASSQGLSLTSAAHNRPVRLILSAGIGNPRNGGTSPAMLFAPEQSADLLLADTTPADQSTTREHLAGIHNEPHTAREFTTWAKNRFSAPIFMIELSGCGFMYRLQNRINDVIDTEEKEWHEEERKFYTSPETTRFLRTSDFSANNKRFHMDFFNALFSSDILVIRLIMPDPEIVFGLLCDDFTRQHPERAGEDFSTAWFLFKETFEITANVDCTVPPYLIGV